MTRPTNPIEYRTGLGIRPFSEAWTVSLKGAYGVPLSPSERELFLQLTDGVSDRPGEGWQEFVANVGRGGGKDDAIKTVVNYECKYGGHEVAAAPGQRLPAYVLCPLRSQAGGMVRMIQGEAQLPAERRHVANVTRDAIEFKNGTVAQVQTCDDVAVVGDTVIVAVRNEWALFGDNDRLIESNLRPALRQIAGTPPHRLIGITSSYTKEGEAWETFNANYGRKDADVLVVQGSTLTFNPNVDLAYLARERRRLTALEYAMHFGCVWQDSVQDGYFAAVLDHSIDRGRPSSVQRQVGVAYAVSMDPAWIRDGWGLAVAHAEQADGQPISVIVDYVDAVTPAEVGSLGTTGVLEHRVRLVARGFGTTVVLTDQAQAQSLGDIARTLGMHLEYRPWTAANKAATYQTVFAAMRDGRVRLPDDPALIREFSSIGTRLLRSGHEQIEARHGHDDRVSAVVMAVAELLERPQWSRAEYLEAMEANRRIAAGGGGRFGSGYSPELLIGGFGDFAPSPFPDWRTRIPPSPAALPPMAPPVRREPSPPAPPPPHQDPAVVAARGSGPYRVLSPLMISERLDDRRRSPVVHQIGEIVVLTAADARSAGDAVEPMSN
ncbi:MAG: hypothetical protein JW751_28490 [Polyangiaceae bacterium]|nr:hypothetical protein [Polyangiaceae bacterium]